MRKVEVKKYDPMWKQKFEVERNKLGNLFQTILVNIHHIGSTSIPGLSAKPIIDLLIEVTDIEKVNAFNNQMTELGYEAKGENGIPLRRYFQKGGDERTHHVHIYETGNSEIKRHLTFRDYLLNHPEKAKRYGKLKEQLAQHFPYDIESYIKGKDNFVKELDRKAKKWSQTRA